MGRPKKLFGIENHLLRLNTQEFEEFKKVVGDNRASDEIRAMIHNFLEDRKKEDALFRNVKTLNLDDVKPSILAIPKLIDHANVIKNFLALTPKFMDDLDVFVKYFENLRRLAYAVKAEFNQMPNKQQLMNLIHEGNRLHHLIMQQYDIAIKENRYIDLQNDKVE